MNTSAQLQELAYHIYYKADGDNTVNVITRYRNQLILVAKKTGADNDDLESIISRSGYREDDLVRIVSKINGQSAKQAVSKSLLGLRWFAGAGISYNDMLFGGDIQYSDSYTVFPKVSTGIDLFTNKNTQQLSFRIEIDLTGDRHTFNNSYEQSQLKVTQYTASIVPQVYYNFYNGEKLKIFAGGGMAFNFSVYPDRYYVTIGGINATPIKQNNYPDYHKFWQSFIIKAGIALNRRIEIYGGYSPTFTLTDNYERFWGNVTSYQAGINYLFGVK